VPEDDEDLVVPGRERSREVAHTRALSNRHAVHEDRARAHGVQPEARARRRPRQPEPRHEGHVPGRPEACLIVETDPPGTREGVGKADPDGPGDAREDEKHRNDGEKVVRPRPCGDR
jgi:hypothetical protein